MEHMIHSANIQCRVCRGFTFVMGRDLHIVKTWPIPTVCVVEILAACKHCGVVVDVRV